MCAKAWNNQAYKDIITLLLYANADPYIKICNKKIFAQQLHAMNYSLADRTKLMHEHALWANKTFFDVNPELIKDPDIQKALIAYELRKKQQEKTQLAGDANKKEGEAFLAANKGKEGVVALPDGLQYKILKQGTGPKPTAGDSVVCNYRGMLINGTEFDSSYKRGQPATFPVSGVIKGWTEALPLMPVGSK